MDLVVLNCASLARPSKPVSRDSPDRNRPLRAQLAWLPLERVGQRNSVRLLGESRPRRTITSSDGSELLKPWFFIYTRRGRVTRFHFALTAEPGSLLGLAIRIVSIPSRALDELLRHRLSIDSFLCDEGRRLQVLASVGSCQGILDRAGVKILLRLGVREHEPLAEIGEDAFDFGSWVRDGSGDRDDPRMNSRSIALAYVKTGTQGDSPHPKIADLGPGKPAPAQKVHDRHTRGVHAQTHPMHGDNRY